MNRFNAIKKFLILIIVLVIPGIAYMLLRTGTNHYKSLPIYGQRDWVMVEKEGKQTADTIYHTIGDFKLLNQLGDTVSQEDLKGTIYVADFFFVSCPTICPKMSTQMSRLAKRFAKTPGIKFISHTVNPEEDSVSVLAEYAKKYQADPSQWMLVTGDKKEIYSLARNGYMVNALQGDGGPDDFIHSELFVLVDKDKRIRGYYDGTSTTQVDTLIDEIKVLMREYINKEEHER